MVCLWLVLYSKTASGIKPDMTWIHIQKNPARGWIKQQTELIDTQYQLLKQAHTENPSKTLPQLTACVPYWHRSKRFKSTFFLLHTKTSSKILSFFRRMFQSCDRQLIFVSPNYSRNTAVCSAFLFSFIYPPPGLQTNGGWSSFDGKVFFQPSRPQIHFRVQWPNSHWGGKWVGGLSHFSVLLTHARDPADPTSSSTL